MSPAFRCPCVPVLNVVQNPCPLLALSSCPHPRRHSQFGPAAPSSCSISDRPAGLVPSAACRSDPAGLSLRGATDLSKNLIVYLTSATLLFGAIGFGLLILYMAQRNKGLAAARRCVRSMLVC